MARFETDGIQELLDDMERMGQQTGPVAQAMTMAAAAVVKAGWQRAITEHGLIDTAAMVESIGYAQTPTNFGDSLGIDIYPQNKDASGTRNAEKAYILHYGSDRIEATYFVDEAESYAEEGIQDELERIWNEWLESGRVPAVAADAGGYARNGKHSEIIK